MAFLLLLATAFILHAVVTLLVYGGIKHYVIPTFSIANNSQFDLYQHLGGNGPFTPYPTHVFGTPYLDEHIIKGGSAKKNYDTDFAPILLPSDIEIDLVSLVSRHHERYPTVGKGSKIQKTLKKFQACENSESLQPRLESLESLGINSSPDEESISETASKKHFQKTFDQSVSKKQTENDLDGTVNDLSKQFLHGNDEGQGKEERDSCTVSGPLAFLNQYQYYVNDDKLYGELTGFGEQSAYLKGKRIFNRYPQLFTRWFKQQRNATENTNTLSKRGSSPLSGNIHNGNNKNDDNHYQYEEEVYKKENRHSRTIHWYDSGAVEPNNSLIYPIFAASSHRDVITAQKFSEGLRQAFEDSYAARDGNDDNRNDPANNHTFWPKVLVIPESRVQGANSLTPERSCEELYDRSYHIDYAYGKYFTNEMNETLARLNSFITNSSDFSLSNTKLKMGDLKNLMELCGFELSAGIPLAQSNNSKSQGKTDISTRERVNQFCSIFTSEDHIKNGYARAIYYYFRNGPANPMSKLFGTVYLNATLSLLTQDPKENKKALPAYLSFAHDTQLNFLYSTLGVFSDGYEDLSHEPLPISEEKKDAYKDSNSVKRDNLNKKKQKYLLDHPWVKGELTPMGATITFERLVNTTSQERYVRLVVNDAVVPISFVPKDGDSELKYCDDGPIGSCSLDTFTQIIQDKINSVGSGDFPTVCKLREKRVPEHLGFFWDGW